jgi:hypothetical protein
VLRTRSVAALVTLVLATGGLLAVGTSSATADPATGDLVGLVKAKDGTYLLDVEVEALGPDGVVEASALTYESDVHPGQDGWFRLEVDPGRYRLRFSKDGYVTKTYAAKVRVESGDEVDFGTVTLARVPKPSRTSGRLKDNRITTTERAKVVVAVASAVTPTGAVTVKEGRSVVGSAKLRRADDGTVTVALPKLARGTHPLKVYYAGSETVAASKSRELKLTVEKPRRHRAPAAYRPNIR